MHPGLEYDLERASSASTRDSRPHSIEGTEGTELDWGNVTEWAIHHHFPNLIEKLTVPKKSNFTLLVNSVHQFLALADVHAQEPPPAQAGDGSRFRINLAELQRMRIRQLQCELVKDVVHMRHSGTESKGWEDRLKKYVEAIQDHDYMAKCTQKSRDPFLVTGARTVDQYVLNQMMSEKPSLFREEYETMPSVEPWERPTEYSSIPGGRNDGEIKMKSKKHKERLFSATLGGTFLIGPMWLMVLLDSWRYTAPITTSVFVSLFGLVMATILDESKDIMASTAAYAAVLVVFVGSNNPASS